MKTFAIIVETGTLTGNYWGMGYLHCPEEILRKIMSEAELDAEEAFDDDDMLFLTDDEVSRFKKVVHSHGFRITKS